MLVHFGEQATEDYEVFLSFRGSDVRKSFADYLYSYLVHSQIRTFRDEEELRKGETIAPSLVQAITESKIYIPILSERYASSKWCLQELAKMVECCRKGKGHIILPIFYFIDPRDVRHQAGVYEEAFEQHSKKHDPRIVQEWRTALLEVGQMKGWHVTENDSQGAVIADVFTTVELHLRSNYTLVTEELVGIDSHVQEVMRLLNLDIGDLKIVGIHGIGGMGKTTIAKAVYDSICTSFDRCCFLENIRELLLKNDGIMSLQNKFISSILRDDVRVKDASEGVRMIRDRVCKYKKVLVVLDDVDDTFEFDQILGKLGHFSSESRFIITTRDKRVLELLQDYNLYEPKEMSYDHSLQLFSKHAFRMDYPPEDHATLCDDFVKVAAGLPLALKVIGSLLFCRDKQFWEEKLLEMKHQPATSNKVQQRLKISYNELADNEKQIFLDIACFFIGEDRESPFRMWSDCKLYPGTGIRTLVLRSLIVIDEENQFWMHDLLRDLGRAIVIEEDVRNPCKRSRIWSNEDAWNMLENVEGADQVEMLRIDMRCDRNLKFAAKTLEKLARLRYLDMTFFTLTGDFKGILPDISLRKLNMCGPKNSEEFDVSKCTEVIKVTNFGKSKKLQKLNLFGCKSVKELPDMSGLVNLDGLNLEGCTELVKVTSFGDMEMLRKLNMPGCKSMKELPDMSCLDNLRDLNLEGCTELNKVAGFGKLEKLRKLNLSGCKSIKELPDMSGLVSLDFLNLEGCTELVEVTSFVKLEKLRKLNMSGCMSIKELSDISGLKNLHDLNLEGCTGLIKVIGFEKLEKLRKLNLSGCRSIKELPNMSGLTSLDFLNLEGCTELIKVTSFEKLEMLQKLNMSGCMSIKELPDMSSLKSLHDLNLEGCTGLIKVTSFEKLEMLRKLNMSGCRSIKELPDMSGLVSLDDLNLVGCTELVKVASFKKLSMLRKLNMSGCRCIKELPDMSDLINLDDLTLVGCTELVKVKGFEKLSMLHKLNMSGCHSIKELPDMSGLKNLRDLNLEGCTQLANMCTSLNH
ncbi:Disease resistance protein L6 [Linum perenne]